MPLQDPRLAQQMRGRLGVVRATHNIPEEGLARVAARHAVEAALDHAHSGLPMPRGGYGCLGKLEMVPLFILRPIFF